MAASPSSSLLFPQTRWDWEEDLFQRERQIVAHRDSVSRQQAEEVSHAPPAHGTAGGRGSSDAAEAGGAAGVAGAGGRRWGVLGVRLVGGGDGKLGLF